MFQSTPPHGGRLFFSNRWRTSAGFNPRPRTGGDSSLGHWPMAEIVSIHAPARGATSPTPPRPCRPLVSIHAPARGATKSIKLTAFSQQFQSTPPHGGRQTPQESIGFSYNVSIHAPARGATPGKNNPHPDTHVSIHAPARGATFIKIGFWRWSGCFNPRPRTGGDRSLFLDGRLICVSIHAPARGATRRRGSRTRSCWCFNPRPRTGGDQSFSFRDRGRI